MSYWGSECRLSVRISSRLLYMQGTSWMFLKIQTDVWRTWWEWDGWVFRLSFGEKSFKFFNFFFFYADICLFYCWIKKTVISMSLLARTISSKEILWSCFCKSIWRKAHFAKSFDTSKFLNVFPLCNKMWKEIPQSMYSSECRVIFSVQIAFWSRHFITTIPHTHQA